MIPSNLYLFGFLPPLTHAPAPPPTPELSMDQLPEDPDSDSDSSEDEDPMAENMASILRTVQAWSSPPIDTSL